MVPQDILRLRYTTEDYDALPGGEVDLLDFIDSNTLEKGVYITDGTDVTEQTIFGSIQGAIDVAETGNTIAVLAGLYEEDVIIATADLVLEGAQAGVSAVDRSAEETNLDGSIKITGTADGTVIDGFTLLDGSVVSGSKAGVYIDRGAENILVQNTIFDRSGDVDGDTYRGILTATGGDQTGLVIQNNSFSGWATGVFLNSGATGAQILDNDFNANFVGMSDDGPDAVTIAGNNFRNNLFEGLGLGSGSDSVSAMISGNDFSGNSVNIGMYTGSGTEVDFSDNSFDGVAADTMTLAQLSEVAETVQDGANSAAGYSGLARLRDGYVFVTAGDSISAGVDLASIGDTVMVGNGIYDLSSTLKISKSLSLAGSGEGSTILDASSVSGYGISVSGNEVSLSDFTLYGPSANSSNSYGIKVSPGGTATSRLTNFEIADVTIRGSGRAELDLNGVNGATISNVTADGRSVEDETVLTNGAGIQITDSANVTVSGSTTLGNAWGGVAIYQANNFYDQQTTNINVDFADNDFQETNGLYSQDSSDSNDFGTLNLGNLDYAVYNGDFRADGSEFTFYQAAEQGAIDFAASLGADASFIRGWTGTESTDVYTVGIATDGTAMSINAAVGQASSDSAIDVLAGTYSEDVVDNKTIAFSFEDAVLNGLTLNSSGSSLLGVLTTTQNGIVFDVDVALDGDTSLTAGEGGISVQGLDGSSAGAQSLSLFSSGTISTGSLGETTRLGSTIVEGAGTTLTGDQYNADSLDFSGPVILTQATTEFNTVQSDSEAGDITFAGNISGSSNGAQDVVFTAGSGTGDASANGSISLQNAGTETVKLGELNVTGDNFTAATVYLADGFMSVQTGDQTFTEQTLNADGNVDSDVGGNITGPINSNGTVNIIAGKNIAGNVSAGTVTATAKTGAVTGIVKATAGTATISAATNITGDISGTDVVASATSVGATVSAVKTATVTATETDTEVGSISGKVTGANIQLTANDISSEVIASELATVTATASKSGGGLISGAISAKNANLTATTITSNVVASDTATLTAASSNGVAGSIGGSVTSATANLTADTIVSNVVALKTASITATDIFAGSLETESGVVKADTIAVDVSGGSVTIDANKGAVIGNPDKLNIVGNGVLTVNKEAVIAASDAGIKQYVVADFVLPKETYIAPSGKIVMPSGLSLAAISPPVEGVTPKISVVQDVQSLGSLLDDGNTAIVLDLNQNGSAGKLEITDPATLGN
jgi:Periplasmic copper-binding protein (NosD)